MARFVSLCIVTLVVLLAYHSATSNGDILDRGESRGCREQIDRQRLSSCREYLRDSSRFEPMTRMAEKERSGWREEFPRCCEDLEQINEKCRCQAIKQVAQQQREEGGLRGREKREMLRTAQSLTSLCRISPKSCEIVGRAPTTFYYY